MLIRRFAPWLAGVAVLLLVIGGLAMPTMKVAPSSDQESSEPDVGEILPEAPVDPVRAIALAPDGRQWAWIESAETGASLWLGNDQGGHKRLLRRSDATDLIWSPDGQWLFLLSPDKLVLLTTSNAPGSGIVTRLGGDTGRRFIATDAWRTAALIATQSDSDGDGSVDLYGLLRVGPGGRAEQLWSGIKRVSGAVAGPDGRVWMRLIGQDSVVIARLDRDGDAQTIYPCRALERCSLVSVDNSGALTLMTSGGRDFDALYWLDAHGKPERVANDPLALGDAENAALDADTRAPVAIHIPYAGGRAVAAAPVAQPLIAAIGRRYPDASEVRVSARAQGHWLVGIRDGQHGAMAWSVADDSGAEWRSVFPARAASQPGERLPVRRFETFAASDGMRLFAYVTRPPDAAGKRLPLVVLVHGGPWSNSPPGYSRAAASLAYRGFLVVEPQFRGSRGYGHRYMLSAGDDFGDGRVLRDIRDSADRMVARGEADPHRMATMGASFGGYAALLATTLWPEHFRGAVAAVPPPDIAWVSAYQAGAEQGDDAALSLKASFASLGLDITSKRVMQRLSGQSPMALAAKLKRPVLLLAGDRDEKVPIRSVNAYAARLCELGKPVTYFVAKGQGHSLDRSETGQSARIVAEDFLAKLLNPTNAIVKRPMLPGLAQKTCARIRQR